MKVLFTCGGTAGHINPAIAVANELRQRRPNTEVLFVGAHGGMECDLVPRAGYDIKTVPASSLKHNVKPASIVHNCKVVLRMGATLQAARNIVTAFCPDVVLGTGGYASFSVVRAASKLGIPTAVHESNVSPGLTTKLLSRNADRMLVSFEEATKAYRHEERVVLTGTPVRSEFYLTTKSEARKKLGFAPDKALVVSCFGSLGARDMNRHFVDFMALEAGKNEWQHLHVTGKFGWQWMPDAVMQAGVDLQANPNIRMIEYLYDMPAVMAAADLFVTRSGASTLAELMVSGTPAILVPSPNVTGNHQEKNALALAEKNAAVLMRESECSGRVLYDRVAILLRKKYELEDLRTCLLDMAQLDAAERIADILTQLAANQ